MEKQLSPAVLEHLKQGRPPVQSFVNTPVTVERDYIRAGRSWWVGFTAPMGQQLGGWCVVDDFGNLVAAQ